MLHVLEAHNIFDKFQSGFRQQHSAQNQHSPESQMIFWCVQMLGSFFLFDLSAAFHSMDPSILIERLRQWVGIAGTALEWISSHLSDKNFPVPAGDHLSSSPPLSYGVPQGSVFEPVLFTIYMLQFGQVIKSFKYVSYHCYTDNTQLYLSFKPNKLDRLASLQDCLIVIHGWMANHFLQLNFDKTELPCNRP